MKVKVIIVLTGEVLHSETAFSKSGQWRVDI